MVPAVVRSTLALARPVAVSALVVLGVLGLFALFAGSIRVLPWLLDPALPTAVTWVFARSVLAVTLEAAAWLALPMGCAVALGVRSERGEVQVFALAGEAPWRSVLRLAPLLLVWGACLHGVSAAAAVSATEPGRVIDELLKQGALDCAGSRASSSQAVPFLGASWVCEPGAAPRLVGRSPVGGVAYVAESAAVSVDLRRIELRQARLLHGALTVRADAIHLRGLPAPLPSSPFPARTRAWLVTVSALAAASMASWAMLASAGRRPARPPLLALVVGALGPLVGLLLLGGGGQHQGLRAGLLVLAAVLLPPSIVRAYDAWPRARR